MGVHIAAPWGLFPFGETAALLILTAAYATAFYFVAVRRRDGVAR